MILIQAVAICLGGPAIGMLFLYLLHYVFDVPVGGLMALELSNLFPFQILVDGQAYPLSDGSKVFWLLGIRTPALPPVLYWTALSVFTLILAVKLTRGGE